MLHWLRKIMPRPVLLFYHFLLAKLAAFLYRHPSNKLIVIGVTGTNGKSSTVKFIAQILEELGATVGYTTTAGFQIAGEKIENKMKMTMPGRFYLQKLLKRMVDAGCTHAIIETSSQGIAQFRHLGVNYDEAVITNLTPEHIESHGGFDAYKKAKGELFAHLKRKPTKHLHGRLVPKISVVNRDDQYADFFLSFPADRRVTFGFTGEAGKDDLLAQKPVHEDKRVLFRVNGEPVVLSLFADFQHKNALAAIAAVHGIGLPLKDAAAAAGVLKSVPGRFELVDEGQPFHVVVDYAYEPYALKALFHSVKNLNPNRVIGIHGSAGGGRDIARRLKIGRMAAEFEDIVIVTNEDPYDEDPEKIIREVAQGAVDAGKQEGKNLFLITERMEAVQKAVELAKPGDAVLLTGKGSEPVMAVAGGKKIPWSDREAARQALKNIGF